MIEMRIIDNGPMCRPEFEYRFVLFAADSSGSLCPPDPDNMWSEWKTAEWVKQKMTTQRDLECEIEELRLEIKENAERIDKLCDILKRNNTKLRTLKGMNYAEKRKEKIINDLQSKNWNIEVMNANYPMLEVIDENTVKIEGVEYKKVEKEKPQTLERIITECMIGYNNTVIVELMERILDRVEVEFFPKLGSIEPPLYNDGWEDCLKELKTRLRE